LAYESHQPPLYYLLSAPVWAAVGAGTDHGQLSVARWRQRDDVWVLAGRNEWQCRAVRLLTSLIGAVGLVLIWALVRVIYPNDRWLPLAATTLAAFLPMRLALATAVSNDILMEALFTASLLAMALMIRHGYTHRRARALGVALGAALLAKSTAVLLLPPALLTLLLVSRGQGRREARGEGREGKALFFSPRKRERSESRETGCRRRATAASVFLSRFRALRAFAAGKTFASCLSPAFFGGCLQTLGIAAVVAGPWLLRNQLQYGDFLAARAFAEYFQPVQSTPEAMMARLGLTPVGFWKGIVASWTYHSFWGVFGPFTVWMSPAVYLALRVPTALAPLGLLVHLGRGGRRERDERGRTIWMLLWLCLALLAVAYVKYNLLIVQPQCRFLLAAMAPISMLATLGWLALLPRPARPVAVIGLVIGMAALALYALIGVIHPYYHG
jgi:4-amino-4-deoxy-L-arabinose transferase-like glycosyltransferase